MEVRCVWWDGYHNAFTDISKYKGNFFITFRHAMAHAVTGNGEIYVIKSNNLENWNLVQTFPALPDSRDPKLFQFQGKLGVLFFACSNKPEEHRQFFKVYISYSEDGENFTTPVEIESHNLCFWKIRNYKKVLYATAYQRSIDGYGTVLLRSEDGEKFEVVSQIVEDDYANEADLLFENNICYAFVRRENCLSPVIAISEYPFTKWEKYTMNLIVRGPHIFKFSGKIYCAGRVFLRKDGKIFSYIRNETEYQPKTAILELDTTNMILKPVRILPSGGDTSYCGSIIDNGKIYISYYSQHEREKRESKVGQHASGIYLATGESI